MENGDIPEDANERMYMNFFFFFFFFWIFFSLILYIHMDMIILFFVLWHLQIAQALSLNLLENLMHVKDAQISKFVPLPPKDLILVLFIFFFMHLSSNYQFLKNDMIYLWKHVVDYLVYTVLVYGFPLGFVITACMD